MLGASFPDDTPSGKNYVTITAAQRLSTVPVASAFLLGTVVCGLVAISAGVRRLVRKRPGPQSARADRSLSLKRQSARTQRAFFAPSTVSVWPQARHEPQFHVGIEPAAAKLIVGIRQGYIQVF